MLPLWNRIDNLGKEAESAIKKDEITELKRIYLMRMEELDMLVKAQEEEEEEPGGFSRFVSSPASRLVVRYFTRLFELIFSPCSLLHVTI